MLFKTGQSEFEQRLQQVNGGFGRTGILATLQIVRATSDFPPLGKSRSPHPAPRDFVIDLLQRTSLEEGVLTTTGELSFAILFEDCSIERVKRLLRLLRAKLRLICSDPSALDINWVLSLPTPAGHRVGRQVDACAQPTAMQSLA